MAVKFPELLTHNSHLHLRNLRESKDHLNYPRISKTGESKAEIFVNDGGPSFSNRRIYTLINEENKISSTSSPIGKYPLWVTQQEPKDFTVKMEAHGFI
ncbi:hypothetical protein EYC80_000736 [Monilinia laxa]|uniref:Uncharacterized protein n=1 Tax=Monilinia laxa TaxID=61186 RepID=A0A5N6K722_MONLA|nr:hypothetical protein EYC80_000736 [Monilinia laxa]